MVIKFIGKNCFNILFRRSQQSVFYLTAPIISRDDTNQVSPPLHSKLSNTMHYFERQLCLANPAVNHKYSNATAVWIEKYVTYMTQVKFHFVPRMYSTTSELTASPYFLWKYSSIKINYFSLIKKLSPTCYNFLKAHSFLSFGITTAILSSLVYPLCLLF